MPKKIETIIIGGGIAGLSCARKLQDSNRDFLLITENIGGRIKTSDDGLVNYGAYYVASHYKNFKEYAYLKNVKRNERTLFHDHEFSFEKVNFNLLKLLPQAIKFFLLLRKFGQHYEKFKTACEHNSQKKVIEADPFLAKLYKMNAYQLIEEKGVKDFVVTYVEKFMYGITFVPLKELNAFTFLYLTQAIRGPTKGFIFMKNKIIAGYRDKILMESVVKITKTENGIYSVKTNEKEFLTKNLVIATPPNISQKLLSLEKINQPIDAYMFHLSGKMKQQFQGYKFHLFSSDDDICGLSSEDDATFLLYSKVKNPDFSRFFTEYEVVCQDQWDPAFSMIGHTLLDSNIDKNLYLIGDNNVCGMEDAFITGLYAANQILKNT